MALDDQIAGKPENRRDAQSIGNTQRSPRWIQEMGHNGKGAGYRAFGDLPPGLCFYPLSVLKNRSPQKEQWSFQ